MMEPPSTGASPAEDLRQIWETHLSRGADETGFLERGGHSLAAVRISAAVEARFGMALPLAGLMRDNFSFVRLREHVVGAGLGDQAPRGAGPDLMRPARRVQPLTSAQQAVWTDEQLKEGSGSYAVAGILRVEARLDPVRLTLALRRVVARHEALTARREYFASGPALVMARTPGREDPARASRPSLVELAPGANLVSATSRLVRELEDGAGLPVRVALLHEDDHAFVVVVVDHLMADAEALDVLFADLAAAYDDPATPEKPAPSYAAFLERQRAFEAVHRDAAVMHWRRSGGVGLPLPLEAPKSAVGGPGPRVCAELDAARTTAVRHALQKRHFTVASALVAAVASVLGRGQGTNEALIGVPVSQRRTAEDLGVVGMALGVLPLALPVRGASDARLTAGRDGLLTGRENAAVGLGELVRLSGGTLDPHHMPVRVWVNDLTGRRPPPRMAGAVTRYVDDLVAAAPFPLNVYLSDVEGALRITLTQDAETFVDPGFAAVLVQQVLDELEALALDRPRHQKRAVGPVEKAGDTVGDQDVDPLAVLREAPGPARVVDGLLSLDRDALWQEVDALVARMAAVGLPEGTAILVEAKRSVHLLVALLASWQLGLVAAVVDAALPAEELDRRARASGVLGRLVGSPPTLRAMSAADDGSRASAPGHVLFTSGTTGDAKVVPMRLSALLGGLQDYVAAAGSIAGDRFGLTGGLGHDPMFRDLLVPLLTGAELYVPDGAVLHDPMRLFRFVVDSRLTVLHATPSLLRLLLAGADGATLDDLRLVVSGGETLTQTTLAALQVAAPGARILNAYGCTESAQVAALLDVTAGGPSSPVLPVGSGCGASTVQVVADGLPAVPGELGEVVIAGPWVSPGDGSRGIFFSGDLGRADTQGRVHLQGRKDRQLSIAGRRVEPERIEVEARRVPGVDQAWAGLDTKAPDTLVLAVTSTDGTDPTDKVRRRLNTTLAPNERPSRLVLVHDFALDDHQKRIGPGRPVRADARPAVAGSGEPRLAALVEREVGVALEPTTNFFDGGLTSVQLLHLRGVLQEELSCQLTPTALFEYPNVRALAAHLVRGDAPARPAHRPTALNPGDERTGARRTVAERRRRAREAMYDDEETR